MKRSTAERMEREATYFFTTTHQAQLDTDSTEKHGFFPFIKKIRVRDFQENNRPKIRIADSVFRKVSPTQHGIRYPDWDDLNLGTP